MVNRTFTKPAIVTGFPKVWWPRFPQARIVAECGQAPRLTFGIHLRDDLVGKGLRPRWQGAAGGCSRGTCNKQGGGAEGMTQRHVGVSVRL